MQTQCDLNLNTITVFGKNAAHRINTGRRDPENLRWKKVKEHLGYGKAMEEVQWSQVLTNSQRKRPTLNTTSFGGGGNPFAMRRS